MDLYKKKIVKFFITFSLIVLAYSYIIILSNSNAANDNDDVYNIKKDTYSNKSMFFSYRRSKHIDELNTGRMINIIGFK